MSAPVSALSSFTTGLEETIAAMQRMRATAMPDADLIADGAVPKVNFADLVDGALKDVSRAQADARHLAQRFSAGDKAVSLQEVVMDLQTASLGFQQMVQVRNKLVQAYQEIMNMPV